ncbi:MAG TPA: CrcB family protein [Nocardioides sp.]
MPLPAPPPAVRMPVAVLLVFLGGCAGTAARHVLSVLVPPVAGVPVTIGAINVVGALLLGLLLGGVRGGPLTDRPHLRLLVGTGVLGGFTTYSALASDGVRLATDGTALGVGYLVGSVVLGLGAAALGVVVSSRRRSGPVTP